MIMMITIMMKNPKYYEREKKETINIYTYIYTNSNNSNIFHSINQLTKTLSLKV